MAKRKNLDFEISFFESLYGRLSKDVKVVSVLAHLYTETGRYDEGLRMDRKLVRLLPDDPTIHYNLACSLALKERKREAVATLRKAIELGYKDFAWMRRDPDLVALREYSPFQKIIAQN